MLLVRHGTESRCRELGRSLFGARSQRFNSLLLLCYGLFQFSNRRFLLYSSESHILHRLVLFEELVE